MIIEPRKHVLVLGGFISAAPFKVRNLLLVHNTSTVDWPSTGAVVLVAGDLNAASERAKLARLLRAHVETAASHGALIVVACKPLQQSIARSIVTNAKWTERIVRFAYKTKLAEVAELCARHPATLAIGPRLDIVGTDGQPITLPKETDLLLKRAFSDFARIVLDPLFGGRSKIDAIWRVDAGFAGSGEPHSPFVVKCGSERDMERQLGTYRDVVADRIPFRGCAPMCIERSVQGATRRLLVSRFIENAERFDERALSHDVTAPTVSIFCDVLYRWRSTCELKPVSLLPAFIPPELEEVYVARAQPAFEKVRSLDAGVHSPREIIDHLKRLAIREVPHCQSHDDLNLRNVFIANNGTEAILIDFTRAIKRPLSKDCARLDVGLAFDKELQKVQAIPDDVLFDFFTGDPFSISLRHELKGTPARHRLAAISAIRKTALAEAQLLNYDITLEYSVAMSAELLYHSRFNAPTARVAYQCAEAIARRL